jgi:protease PrsW
MSMPFAAAYPPAAPVPTRRTRSRVVVVVTALLLLGAAGIVVAVVIGGGPKAAALAFGLAAVPVGPLIACYLWLDRYEPEPLRYLMVALGWGAVVATAAALALELFVHAAFHTSDAITGGVVAPFIEEGLKGAFLVIILVLRRREIDGPLDGVVYAGMVGIGFAFTENVLYYTAAYLGTLEPLKDMPHGAAVAGGVFFFRGVIAPFAHPLFTAATGIGVGLAAVTSRRWVRLVAPVAGYLTAVALHAAWNSSVLIGGVGGFFAVYLLGMLPVFGLAVGFALWIRHREGRVLTAALYDCARLGLLNPGEVRWIASLRDRAAARRYARHLRGAPTARAVKEYQQAATELGFLHHRIARGSAPPGAARRERELWLRMLSWRPFVVLPPLPAPPRLEPPTGPPWKSPYEPPSSWQQPYGPATPTGPATPPGYAR